MTPRPCSVAMERHRGPILTTVGGRGYEFLVDLCEACGYEVAALKWLTPEKRAIVLAAAPKRRAP